MNDKVILTPGQKALRINLDNTIYGSFVEIGAKIDDACHLSCLL